MTDKQPITLATIRVQDDEFWNWLADTSQMNFHDLTLVGANELPSGDIEFVLKRKEQGKLFTEEALRSAMTPVKVYPMEYPEDGRFERSD